MSETGEEFFCSLVTHLTSTLPVQYAVIGEVGEGRLRKIRTLAVSAGDTLVDNFENVRILTTGGRPAEHPRQRSWIQSGLRQGERAWVAQYGRSYAEDRGATHRLVKGELGNTRHT